MDDTAACADLCESHGFAAPAAALRALARGEAPFYMVRAMMRVDDEPGEWSGEADTVPSRWRIFRDRGAAELHARRLTAQALRNYRPDLEYGPPSALSRGRFVREVGAILGITYELPAQGARLFPESATDEQLWRISQLLYFTLFDVAEFGSGPARDDG